MRLTLKEIINKKIMHVGVILTIIYLLVYATGLYNMAKDYNLHNNQLWLMQQIGYQLLTLGWYMSTFLAGVLAILAGTGSIANEIETGTILSLASKPLRRRSIITGKFLAYSLVTALYSGLLVGAVTILAIYYFKLVIELQMSLQGSYYLCFFQLY
jgi:ABC-type transport system involved in multi-copper enzyme maturation permease subunit